MATYSKIDLSASTDGRGIAVAATATAGTLIHTGSSTATTYDEIWLYATNTHSADEVIVVEFGASGSGPADYIYQTIESKKGLALVIPGLVLQGNSSSALTVKVFNSGGASGRLNVFGYVNRITA
tara:strand:- start:260 stop:634 length:375 start_codon:yes stop_codon:yes gene_type:complete